jgi:hypothetical protein
MEAVPHMRKLVLAGAIASLTLLGTSTAAYGKGCPGNVKNPPSSVAQYTEQIPTACGSSATGGSSKSRSVPKSIERKIDSQGGQDAPLLKKIVSEKAYGAPETTIKVHKAKPKAKAKAKVANVKRAKIVSDSAARKSTPVAASNPVAASFGVITDGSDARLIALIALMVAVAAVVVFSALRRRRITR